MGGNNISQSAGSSKFTTETTVSGGIRLESLTYCSIGKPNSASKPQFQRFFQIPRSIDQFQP
ncbi:hypothetical protein N752_28530 [Desulforamulus aquiferis]|nr:hypothetical protein N752_28530 [Desulforamulus aquiferis]